MESSRYGVWGWERKKRSKKRTLDQGDESEEAASDIEEGNTNTSNRAGTSCSKKKKTASEERESRVVELKKKLREKHGSDSGIQFSVWAETIAAGNHESLDSPPPGILNFGSRPRGRSNHLEETLTNVVGKIASALSPAPTTSATAGA